MTILAFTILIVFLSALIKSTLGFGEALLAMPLLTLLLGIQTAAPIVSLMGILLTLLILRQSWQKIELSDTWRILAAYLVGIPIGILGLRTLPSSWLTTGLGIFLILVGLFYLLRPSFQVNLHPNWSFGFGFLGGLLSGAYNTGGPPIVLWGTFRRWPPDRFRANLQSCFLPAGFVTLFGHAAAGLWTSQVIGLFAASIPALILAYWFGGKIQQRLPVQRFERSVYLALVALGVALIL